jgi:hypothetical protein
MKQYLYKPTNLIKLNEKLSVATKESIWKKIKNKFFRN